MVQDNWKRVKLENILTPSKIAAKISPLIDYRQVTVRMNHKGLILREEKLGQNIKSNQWFVKKNQFVLSRIDARNGAMGIVPPELDGAIVTNDFLRFDIDENQVNIRFFNFLTRTDNFIHQCNRASEGTTNRKRLRPDLFLKIEISLPNLNDQKRIVEYLDFLWGKFDEMKRHQEETELEIQVLMSKILTKTFLKDINE